MRNSGKLSLCLMIAGALLSSGGCSRDRNARKQKYFESGQQYFQAGKYQEATIQFLNAVQVDTSFAAAHYQLARCYLRQKLLSSAYRELAVTVQLDPKNWQAQLDFAGLLFRSGQFSDARARAASILEDNPTELGAQLLLATSDGELGNLRLAIDEAQRGVQMAPDKPAPYVTLGLLQEKAQQLNLAEQNLEKAVSLDAKFLPARMGLGTFYQRRGRWQDAEAQFRAGIEADNSDPLPRSALSALYFGWGKKDLAEKTLLEAKKAIPHDPAAYRLLGDFYVASGETGKALNEFALLSQEHPDDLAVKKRYIGLLIGNKQYDKATALDDEILKQNSKDAEALLLKGETLNLEQRFAEAVPVLEASGRSNPDDPAAHFQLGLAYFRSGNLDGAEREWRESVRLKPSLLEAQQNLAMLELRKGDMRQLEQSASDLLKYAPAAPQGYLARGLVRMKRGEFAGAESDLRRTIELDPRNAMAYTRLGDICLTQQRFAEAENFYEQALAQDPRSPEALQGLVTQFLLQKQPVKARQRVEAQVARVPDQSSFQYLLGKTLLADHKTAEAAAALTKALELDPKNLSASLLLGQAQEASGQLDQAASAYEHAMQANAGDAQPYVFLGALEEHRGNWQKAQDLYRKALKLQPDQSAAANNLSYLLLEHGGDINDALSLAQIAHDGMPQSPNAADTLAWAYYKMGSYNSALPLLQEAVKKAPQNATYYYHLGLVYQKTKKVAQAKNSFQRALQLDPKSPRAEEIRRALAELNTPPS